MKNNGIGEKRSFSIVDLYNKVGILLILVLLLIICSILSPIFLSSRNLINLLTQTSVVTIIACGITMLIITGNTDLSAGSMVALTGCMAMGTYKQMAQSWGVSPFISTVAAILVAIAVCMMLYGTAAVIMTRYSAPAFIVTLAVNTAARGLALMYTNAKVIKQIGDIVNLGQGKAFNVVPLPVLFMIVIALITWVILTQTRLGKYLYAIGGNMESAKAAGIRTKSVVIKSYLIHAVFVGIAGVLFMARINSGQPAEAVGLEFDAITAAIIGGASLAGGVGTITGTIIGSLIIGVIKNILTLMGVQSYYQQIITGVIIVLAVVIDIKTKAGKRR